MKKKRVTLLLFSGLLAFLLNSCNKKKEETPETAATTQKDTINWSLAQAYYLQHMQEALAGVDSLKKLPQTGSAAEAQFARTHRSFKLAEPYGSYLNPEVGHRANGPALPIVTDDTQRVLPPIGLQKIEENIFDGAETEAQHRKDLDVLSGMLRNLHGNIQKRELTAQRFFIATHQQLMRIASLSTAGFDTPVSGLSIQEIPLSLRSLREVYERSLIHVIQTKDNSLHNRIRTSRGSRGTVCRTRHRF